MKEISILLLGLCAVNIGLAALAAMIDEDKWVKCFMIAAIILGVSGFVLLTIALKN